RVDEAHVKVLCRPQPEVKVHIWRFGSRTDRRPQLQTAPLHALRTRHRQGTLELLTHRRSPSASHGPRETCCRRPGGSSAPLRAPVATAQNRSPPSCPRSWLTVHSLL